MVQGKVVVAHKSTGYPAAMSQYRVCAQGIAMRQLKLAPSRPARSAVGPLVVRATQQPQYTGAGSQPAMGFGGPQQQAGAPLQYSGMPTGQQPQPQAAGQPQQLALVPRRQAYPQQPVYLNTSQVTGKQVITRSSGKSLGVVGGFWVDSNTRTVVSFDLEEKKTMSSTKWVTGRGAPATCP